MIAAFTLTELLVVIAILAVLAATQLPALTRAKAPVKFTQCMNNLRQIGRATMLYMADNDHTYPFGDLCGGSGPDSNPVVDAHAWPMELLRYMSGYQTNIQPMTYVCPSEKRLADGWAFQVHYQANRHLLGIEGRDPPIAESSVRRPSILWMFIEKELGGFCNIRVGGLGYVLSSWNLPPGWPGYRRYSGGMTAVAADGHTEWLRTPPYQPIGPPPSDFLELGDNANGRNAGNAWQDNGGRVKLYTREITPKSF